MIDEPIPFPDSWAKFENPSQRFEFMFELYGLCHWNDPAYKNRTAQYIFGLCNTFFDDSEFFNSPKDLVPASMRAEEIALAVKFGEQLDAFLRTFETKKWIEEVEWRKIPKSEIDIPKSVIDSACALYHCMINIGDPGISSYY
jgi:hypothetical protein